MYRYGELEDDDNLKRNLLLGSRVLCGGKRGDPLHWMRNDNNMGPTCGRTAPRHELEQHDFTRSTHRKVYLCSHCGQRFV